LVLKEAFTGNGEIKKGGDKQMAYNNRNVTFKGSEKKPQRYSKDSFTKELIGKVVKITLKNGSVVQGRLLELGMYDVKLQTSQNQLIVLKSAILTVEVM
jgi:sRNA-binding regulator protein Hfq